MTFKLQKNRTFRTIATLQVPSDDGPKEETLSVRFRVLPDEDQQLPVEEFLTRAILHVDDVLDEEGEAVPHSEGLVAALVAQGFVRAGLMRAYWQALAGARTGN